MDDLKKISHLLYAPGEVMPGIEMSLAEACARGSAAALHDEVPFCVVRDWIWIDLIVPGRVLYDSANRFQEGDWVRTTQLI